ncbi:MAG: putative toxin-antitoxin system toxin component, PIN family [Pseudomonadota bacterium]
MIDTNIYISAIFWGGKPREVVDLGRDENMLIFTSSDIEREIAEKLRTKFRLDEEETNQIILDFSTFTIPVKITKQIQAVPDDPDDDKFIECAVSCGADFIVSGDQHLLRIKEYEGIKILTAAEFLPLTLQHQK